VAVRQKLQHDSADRPGGPDNSDLLKHGIKLQMKRDIEILADWRIVFHGS
jgi:hypothetical protein